jgi:hypothetical protein
VGAAVAAAAIDIHGVWLVSVKSIPENPARSAATASSAVSAHVRAVIIRSKSNGISSSWAIAESRTRLRCDAIYIDLFAAVLAGQVGVGDLAAGVVAQNYRWTLRAGEVFVTPAHERDYGGEQVAPSRRQPVFAAVRIARVEDPLEKTRVDKRAQSRGESRSGDLEIPGELPEAPDAEERLAQDEQGPAFADERQGAPDGLSFESMGKVVLRHHGSLTIPV